MIQLDVQAAGVDALCSGSYKWLMSEFGVAPGKATASLEHPDAIAPVTRAIDYSKDLTLDLEPFTVMVLEIRPA